MASKPTIALSRWADTISAVLTTPPSGLRDTGFVGGTIIDEGTVNYEINQLYQWALWLSDGDCAFHNLSATGTLGVTGATTLTGALTANGGTTTTTLAASGNATVGGTLGVTGASTQAAITASGLVTANAGVTVATGQAVTLSGTATLTAGGLITANAGVTVGANQHVTVSGTGEFKHGSRSLVIPASAANSPNIAGNLWAFNSDTMHWLSSAVGDQIVYPLWVPTGRRITQLDFWYQRAGGTLTFDFRKATLSTNSGGSIANTTVASGTSLTSVSLTSINYTLLATEQYGLRVTAGAANDQSFAVVVTYDNL